MRRFALIALVAGLLPAATRPATAQTGASLLSGVPDSAILAGLDLRNIGPAVMSGRVSDISVQAPARPGERWGRVMYITSAGGGAWKSDNGGKTWRPITDELRAGSTGAIAVAPSDSNIVYLGSGESNNLRSSSWGDGIYKSTDGGETWTHVGLARSQHIARIVVHPNDANIVYVAAMGPLWGPGGERGIYKTTDGGRTWNAVKTIDETTGFTDIVLDPTNPEVVYAASYQRERRPWSFVAGGENSSIWKSLDGGATWTEIANGLPDGAIGRIGIAIVRSQPRTLYASIHHAERDSTGVYRTDDGGETWRRMSGEMSIPWYFGQLRADPKDPERVYFLGVPLRVSEDGGRNWRTISQGIHVDQHAMWVDPDDPSHLIVGNDGGLYISYDYGESWDFAVNLPISTFYAIGYDMAEPYYRVYGGLQDNGSWGAPIATREQGGILNTHWQRVGGGDGFYAQIDATDPSIVFVESQNGNIRRVDARIGESKPIRPEAEEGEDLRYNWSAPIHLSPHDARIIWFGANVLFRSPDRGDTWTRVSGDLTRALDRDTLPIMGMREAGGLGRHDGTAPYGNISTISESPITPGLVWVGTDDGLVQVTSDGGANWMRIDSLPGAPKLTYVSRVVASRHDPAVAYVTLDGHRNNDFAPYVYRTTDSGRTWTSIVSNLPEGSLQVIREHHRNPDLLFAGSEFGAFVSVNGGESWAALEQLPGVAVHDLLIHPRENDLILGTHGRGIWILDDLAPLEHLAEAAAQPAFVFEPRNAVTFNPGAGPEVGSGDRQYEGEDRPTGALLSYWVRASDLPAEAALTLTIADGAGTVVRTLDAPSGTGVHRVVWDLHHEPVVAPEPREEDEEGGFGGGGGGVEGPFVAPGRYAVQLRSGDRVLHEAALTVERDPLVPLTDAELASLQETRMRAYGLQKDIRALALRLENAHTRVSQARAASDTTSGPGAAARSLEREIEGLLARLCGARRGGGQGGGGQGGGNRGPAAGCSGGGGGFGGGGGGGGEPGAFRTVTGVAGSIGELHFMPAPGQLEDLDAAASVYREASGAAESALGRVNGVVQGLG